MPLAPLELEKAFNRLKVDLAEARSVDVRLLLCARHWSDLREHRGQSQHATSLAEFVAILEKVSSSLSDLADCTLEELADIEKTLSEAGLTPRAAPVAMARARTLCFVGDIGSAARICAETHAEKFDDSKLQDALGSASSGSERALLGIAVETLRTSAPQTSQTLRGFLGDWEALSETLSYDRAHCLLVESGRLTDKPRGRLRELCGQVGPLGSFSIGTSATGAPADELTFDNQLRTPDDPAVGVVYNALTAVRKSFAAGKAGRRYSSMSFRARYSITGAGGALTGGSIGLASGILAFTSLLKRETLPDERFVSGVAGVTGALEESGAVIPVNDHSFNVKARRAFFSHLKYFVVPSEQAARANLVTEELRKSHPRRRLHVIPAETLEDVLSDLNVVRSEKVPPGKYIARKIIKHARATKVQVPLLVILLYSFVCILFPKARFWFDWNPAYLTVNSAHNGIEISNADSIPLWSVDYECESIDPESAWKIGDIDNDGKHEVAFSPKALFGAFCSSATNLYVYKDNGDLLFSRNCSILGQYPGDTLIQRDRGVGQIAFVNNDVRTNILTTIALCFPSRTHIRLWSGSGDSLGWYVNAGAIKVSDGTFASVNGLGYVFIGINNRSGAACLFVLPEDQFYGVSPPYTDPEYDLSGVIRGNQIAYVIFPPSDVSDTLRLAYNESALLEIEPNSFIKVSVAETRKDAPAPMLIYYMDQNLRVYAVRASDVFLTYRENKFPLDILSSVGWDDYLANMRDSVQYFTDSGWVTEGQLRAAEQSIKK